MERRARLAIVLALCCLSLPLAGCEELPGTAPPTGDPGLPADGEVRTATVTEVIDGDTITVRFGDGTIDTVRLLGVDTPETRGDTNPGEFEGVPDTAAGRSCLDRAAGDATRAMVGRLLGEEVEIATDPSADRRDRYDRLLAYVVEDGENVNYWLVERGHARVYDSTFAFSERFYAAESEAQSARRGVWACRSPATATPSGDLRLRVHADAPGNDRENPNGEFVVLRNVGDEPVAIGNWTLADAAGHEFVFPANATIPPSGSVTVYSGAGASNATHFYWGEGAVWNNDGDTATLRDANGTVRASESY